MANMMIRHPAETQVVKKDGYISLEWSAYLSIYDKVVSPLTNVPSSDLNNIGTTLAGINDAIAQSGDSSLADLVNTLLAAVNAMNSRWKYLQIYNCFLDSIPVDDTDHQLINVLDASGGPTLAYWSGSEWLAVNDLSPVA
jgi:hypothetical protein